MSPRQTALVQDTFAKIAPISETAAAPFYGRLFELDPALRPLFKGDMAEQGRKLMQMIQTAVAGLRQPERIVPAVEALGRRHAAYGVTEAHYSTVAAALLWTLEQGLGDGFTPEVEAAWTDCYGFLAGRMIAAGAA